MLCHALKSQIFDSDQEIINFDIEINSESAEGLFYKLKELVSVKSIRAEKITSAAEMFFECEKLEKISGLNFQNWKMEDVCLNAARV